MSVEEVRASVSHTLNPKGKGKEGRDAPSVLQNVFCGHILGRNNIHVKNTTRAGSSL